MIQTIKYVCFSLSTVPKTFQADTAEDKQASAPPGDWRVYAYCHEHASRASQRAQSGATRLSSVRCSSHAFSTCLNDYEKCTETSKPTSPLVHALLPP